MPKRTNAFQKLVLRINQHFASSSAVVTESKMMWDERSGQDREIDICIEDTVGTYKVFVGVECTAKKYKVGTQILEQLLSKHRSVGIHRTVVVSKYGFADGAKKFAKRESVELLDFDGAFKADWPEYFSSFRDMKIAHRSCRVSQVDFAFNQDAILAGFDATYPIYVVEGDRHIPVADYALNLFKASPSATMRGRSLEDLAKESGGVVLTERFEFSPPLQLQDKNGIRTETPDMTVYGEVVSSVALLPMGYGQYGDQQLAYGEAKGLGPFTSASVTVSQGVHESASGKPGMKVSINLNTGDA